MKKLILFVTVFLLAVFGCVSCMSVTVETPTVPATNVSTATVEPATTTPEVFIALTQAVPETDLPTESQGLAVTYPPLSLIVPPAIANGASGSEQPRVDSDDAAWWQKTPGHLLVSLGDYYVLQGKTHQPQIAVYPALEYAELVPAAFEAIHRLDNILYGSVNPEPGNLPAAPFINAQQSFASNIQVLSFQNGSGVRFVTQYDQYAAPANNQDLFYQFQGVTRDGAYYIVAIFPLTTPVLAETSAADAPLPEGGIVYPDMMDTNADFPGYYAAVTGLLNAQPPEAFTPTLDQLDALVQSMLVAP